MKTAITAFVLTLMFLIPALACGTSTDPTQTPANRTQPTERPAVADLNPIPTNPPTPTGGPGAISPGATPNASPSGAATAAVSDPTLTASSRGAGNPANQETAVPQHPDPTPTPTPTRLVVVNPTPTQSSVGLVFRPTATPTPTPTPAPPAPPTPTPEYYSSQFSEADYQRAIAGLPDPPQSRPENHCNALPLVMGPISYKVVTYDSTPEGIKETPNYRHILDALYTSRLRSGGQYQQPIILTQHYREQMNAHYRGMGYEDQLRLDGCAQFEVMHPEVPIVRYLWNFQTRFVHDGQSVEDLWSLQAYFIVENAPELKGTGTSYKARLVGNRIDAAMVNDACELAMPIGKLFGC